MLHKLTKIKIIINEIWSVFKIFDSVIANEVLSLYLLVFFLICMEHKSNHIFINGRSEKYMYIRSRYCSDKEKLEKGMGWVDSIPYT